ncbi:MAG: phosphate regulon sensor histidine kinase PhoR [Porticoccaceae bacterium]
MADKKPNALRNYFLAELKYVIVLIFSWTLLGAFFGYPISGTLFGFAVYMVWSLIQIYRLNEWIKHKKKSKVPVVRGIYGYFLQESLNQKREHKHENKKLKAAMARQRDLMEGVRDAAILVDAAGKIQWFNRQARQMLELKSKDREKPVLEIINNDSFVDYFSKGKFAEPLSLQFPPDTNQWVETSITKYKNGDHIILLRDITRLRKLENMRRDFIANLSHELRTPLTVLRGYLETLQLHPNTDDSLKRIFIQMDEQGLRMANLVQDLTTLSRLESLDQDRHEEPVDITALIKRIVRDAEGLDAYKDHKIKTEIQDDYFLMGVETELRSVFGNLVFNAVRYTPPGSKITISVSKPKSGLRVTVEDNGPGIEEKHISRLTERFYRVDKSRSSGTGGTGLGLAIAKHALASHKGRLSIKSKVGEGSKFSCVFPREKLVKPPKDEPSLRIVS